MNQNSVLTKSLVPRISLADSVYETLLEAILSGGLKEGAELNAVSLADQLQVSRTPVQEAIKRLEVDGLVINPLGKKARVAQFSAKDVREVYQMRIILESTAAALAANNLSNDQLLEMRNEANELAATQDAVDWSCRALEYDIRFHHLIGEASGNQRLRDDIARYRLLVRGFCRMTGQLQNLRAAFAEHLQILAALEARDAAAARSAMQNHIQNRLETVLNDTAMGAASH